MKKFLCITIISVFAISIVYGQPQRRPFERVHAAKVAYITDRIQLSREQAEQFWPVYNEFEKERIILRKKYFKHCPADETTKSKDNYQDEEAARQTIEDNLDYQQGELDLKRKYKDEFLKIISATQLADLYKADREFRQLLMQRLRERHTHKGWR
jgi:hypothetical protein